MASTYTANTGIEKPGSGEQSGTWGTTTNTNFDIIDQGLHGVGTLTLTGPTAQITTSDGAASLGQYTAIILNGSPGQQCTITITPNDQTKVFLIYNSTNQTAVFSQSNSGANATVLAGRFAWIYADGAGNSAAVVATAFVPADGTVTSASIADGSIATVDLANGAVTSTKILSGTIQGSDIASNTIGSGNIIDGTIINADISGSAAIAFSKMANLTASRALVSDGNGDVSAASVTSTELGYLSGVTSSVQTQLNNVSVMPNNIAFYTTAGNHSLTLPSGTGAVLITAAGGGGGGGTRGPGGGNTAYNGGGGGDSTVTGPVGINMRAKGGSGGNGDGSYSGPFSTGDSGGAVFVGGGGAGGAQDGNFDITGNEGRKGNLVKTYVKNAGLSGGTLSISVGGGGASSGVDSSQPGAGGFVEVWYW